ncbi:50S ribosomal protein L30 [Coxiella endosymbiont of Amblyomma nuttalli]|uniref:50S ribosomal protein L30 n=1 Tax=Coxiella endosymbiont of Amblyomma nuttalli TaxID=2749996 RepID=UPI001BA500D2|nr:50S ribosomal protein L30 [Coxiella endosymbiont of Amblyomma nuttalli]QTS83809.1 50S ribosomal protein L30 [Coxiella endosymbiont of Amblyomma nuttalli]
MEEQKLRVTLMKSKFGRKRGHRECVEALGLRHIRQSVEVADTYVNRGLIKQVAYLLQVEAVRDATK